MGSSTRLGFLHSSLSKGQTYLGEHFSPILGLVALLYRVFDSTYFLFLFQSLVLGAPALLIYALAVQKKIPRPVAVVVSICYLLYQPLRTANNFDFREDNMFIGIFLAALLALEKGRLLWFWAMCLVSWIVKENAPIFTGLIGAWLVLAGPKRRINGFALGLLSVAAFFVINTKITPHFVGTGVGADTMLVKRMRHFGNSNAEIFHSILSHPFGFIFEIAQPFFHLKALKYFLDVTAPFLFFVPAAPLPALIVLAGISMNLLVNQPTIGFHYECILIPFLFYILLAGLAALNKRNKLSGVKVVALVFLSFLLFYGRSPVESIRRFWPNAHQRFVADELRKIPESASVATQSALYPHVSHRKDAFLYSAGVPATDYIIADLSPGIDLYATMNLATDVARIDPLVYSLEFDHDNLRIWRRKTTDGVPPLLNQSGTAPEDCGPECEDIEDSKASNKAASVFGQNVRRYCSFDVAVQETVKEIRKIPSIVSAGAGPKNIYIHGVVGGVSVMMFNDFRELKPDADCIK